jgi:hypothetical protein
MGKTYGRGLTDGPASELYYNSAPPRHAVRMDDDSQIRCSDSEKDGKCRMTNIGAIIGREMLDSRGNPTVEAEVQLAPRATSGG